LKRIKSLQIAIFRQFSILCINFPLIKKAPKTTQLQHIKLLITKNTVPEILAKITIRYPGQANKTSSPSVTVANDLHA